MIVYIIIGIYILFVISMWFVIRDEYKRFKGHTDINDVMIFIMFCPIFNMIYTIAYIITEKLRFDRYKFFNVKKK